MIVLTTGPASLTRPMQRVEGSQHLAPGGGVADPEGGRTGAGRTGVGTTERAGGAVAGAGRGVGVTEAVAGGETTGAGAGAR